MLTTFGDTKLRFGARASGEWDLKQDRTGEPETHRWRRGIETAYESDGAIVVNENLDSSNYNGEFQPWNISWLTTWNLSGNSIKTKALQHSMQVHTSRIRMQNGKEVSARVPYPLDLA